VADDPLQSGQTDETSEANKPSLKWLNRLIKKERRGEVLAAIEDLSPADVMNLLIQLPLKRARKLYSWLPAALFGSATSAGGCLGS
jgi:magnesium transporter